MCQPKETKSLDFNWGFFSLLCNFKSYRWLKYSMYIQDCIQPILWDKFIFQESPRIRQNQYLYAFQIDLQLWNAFEFYNSYPYQTKLLCMIPIHGGICTLAYFPLQSSLRVTVNSWRVGGREDGPSPCRPAGTLVFITLRTPVASWGGGAGALPGNSDCFQTSAHLSTDFPISPYSYTRTTTLKLTHRH